MEEKQMKKDMSKIDELLSKTTDKALRKHRTQPKLTWTVTRFIKKFDIQEGSIRIPTFLIWYHYKKNFTAKNMKHMKYSAFFRVFSSYFPKKYKVNVRGYYLNNSLDSGDDIMLAAKSYEIQTRLEAKRKNREKETRQNTHSLSQSKIP